MLNIPFLFLVKIEWEADVPMFGFRVMDNHVLNIKKKQELSNQFFVFHITEIKGNIITIKRVVHIADDASNGIDNFLKELVFRRIIIHGIYINNGNSTGNKVSNIMIINGVIKPFFQSREIVLNFFPAFFDNVVRSFIEILSKEAESFVVICSILLIKLIKVPIILCSILFLVKHHIENVFNTCRLVTPFFVQEIPKVIILKGIFHVVPFFGNLNLS